MNKIITTSLIAVGLVSAAHAFTPEATVYITGATAFRGQVWNILNTAITAPTDGTAKVQGAGSANQYTFMGTWKADGSALANKKVAVYCGYSGSAAGQRDVIQGNTIPFVSITGAAVTSKPDLAFSDVKQKSTDYAGSSVQLAGVQVAVVPFIFAGNANAIAVGATNVTDQSLSLMLANGYQFLPVMTGKSSDEGQYVYVTGRDNSSGTRITVLAESGFGINTSVQQYKLVSGVWTAFDPNSGYSSGGSVRADLNTAAADPAIGYLGLSDAYGSSPLANGAAAVNYNGVAYSRDAVINGAYTLWTYENLFSLPSPSANAATFKAALLTEIASYLNTSGDTTAIRISDMVVSRNSDGGSIQR